jgi:hypothetical protein
VLGAKADGKTDATAALQTALEAARTQGPVCFVPPGHYRIDGALTVPPGVTLCGASGGVPHSEHPIGLVVNGCDFMDEGKRAVRLEAGLPFHLNPGELPAGSRYASTGACNRSRDPACKGIVWQGKSHRRGGWVNRRRRQPGNPARPRAQA